MTEGLRWRSLAISTCVAVLAGAGTVALLRKVDGRAAVERPGDIPNNSRGTSTTADDLDREQIDQLHAATLKASDTCFELKKLCATVLVPSATLVLVFTDKRLNEAVFIAGQLIIIAFWLADTVGYFYQRRLRVAMAVIWARRAARCPELYDHVPELPRIGPIRAAFNSSMIYYLILTVLVGSAFVLFKAGAIGSMSGIGQ